jgi:MFS family permease
MAGVAYAFAVTMVGTTLPTPLYPIYQTKIGFSDLIVTVVYAAYGAGVIAALLLIGPKSDRFGRRRVLLPGLVVAAASSVVFLLAESLAALFVGRVLSGLSAGAFTGTATATLLDLAPAQHRARATLIATAVNMGGLGLGPLLAGSLAEWAPDPLRTPYAVHLALLLPAAAAVWLMPETVTTGGRGRTPLINLGVPAEIRGTFIRAGTAAFAAFATMGLFTAVAPAFLGKLLHLPNHALSGAVVFLLFAASTAGQLAQMRFAVVVALRGGCACMIAGMSAIAAGLGAESLALLLVGAAVAGFGTGLSFRAGLASINEEAPAERRGELNSTFFLVAYLALSVPIIGVGVAGQAIGLRDAGLVFSGCVGLLALAVLLSLTRVSSARRERPPGKPRSAATEGSTGSR